MTTLYRNPSLRPLAERPQEEGYSMPRELDTRIPPKAAPVTREISVNGVAIPENIVLAEAQNHPAGNPGEAVRAAAQALVVRELLHDAAGDLLADLP